jgi:hypothetical protein
MTEYSIYIPSKGRYKKSLTADMLLAANAPFKLVVEPQDAKNYIAKFGKDKVIVMKENDMGVAYVRNFIKEYSIKNKENFHWQIDDDMRGFLRRIDDKNIKSEPIPILKEVESFVNQYRNIGAACLCSSVFAFSETYDITVNKMVYGCVLINNKLDISWKPHTSEDVDYSLKVLLKEFCTVKFNRLLQDTVSTESMKGGCTEIEYANGGRLRMALQLESDYSGGIFVVDKETGRVKPSTIWNRFKHKLKRIDEEDDFNLCNFGDI